MGKKIYNRKFKCVRCHRIIEEYNSENKQRAVKSWVSLCTECYKDLNRNQSSHKSDLRKEK